jgi:DNA-3-methyladenine glycosylase I
MAVRRCQWCGSDPLYQAYHDKEWGVPLYQDRKLFEMLTLEGAQAGLSWITILKKRQHYRKAFDRFRPESIASYTSRDIKRLMTDPGIVRNRLKIEATIHNARVYLQLRERHVRFSDFLWQFVDGTPKTNRWQKIADIPATTPESDAMSKALKHKGFKFIGSTTCYAFMQAVGMVNDHTTDCFRYPEIRRLG